MRRLRLFRKADEGQVLVLTALALLALMLIAGLGIDVGFLRNQKHQMQKPSDAVARTVAPELVYGTLVLAAAAASHNYLHQSGPFLHHIEYVEVIVARAQPNLANLAVSQAEIGVVGDVRGRKRQRQSTQESAAVRSENAAL